MPKFSAAIFVPITMLSLLSTNVCFAANQQTIGNGVVLNQGNFSIYEGTVVKVNPKKRELTLKSTDGQTIFKAPPEMKNFKQVHLGDSVKVNLEISVTIEKLATGAGVVSKTLDSAKTTAPESSKPAQTITRKTTLESQIYGKLDEESLILVKNLQGEDEKIHINQPGFYQQLQVGDTIKISYHDQMKAIVLPRKELSK